MIIDNPFGNGQAKFQNPRCCTVVGSESLKKAAAGSDMPFIFDWNLNSFSSYATLKGIGLNGEYRAAFCTMIRIDCLIIAVSTKHPDSNRLFVYSDQISAHTDDLDPIISNIHRPQVSVQIEA